VEKLNSEASAHLWFTYNSDESHLWLIRHMDLFKIYPHHHHQHSRPAFPSRM